MDLQTESEAVVTPEINVAPVEVEKTLTQSQVNEIVKREKASVADKVRREMTAEIDKMQSASSMGGMPQENLSEIEDRVFNRLLEKAKQFEDAEGQKRQEALDAEHRQAMEKVANQFFLKMGAGKEQFPDFEEVMTDFEPQAFPQLAFLAAELDNTAGIMYELAKNPGKLAQLNMLAERSPKQAKKEMDKLSQSIVQNQQALNDNVSTNAPLSRLKSSTVGADTGKMGLKDFKNADWLRG